MCVWDPPADAQVMGPDTCPTPTRPTRAQASRSRATGLFFLSLFLIPAFCGGIVTSIFPDYETGATETRDEDFNDPSADPVTQVSPLTTSTATETVPDRGDTARQENPHVQSVLVGLRPQQAR